VCMKEMGKREWQIRKLDSTISAISFLSNTELLMRRKSCIATEREIWKASRMTKYAVVH